MTFDKIRKIQNMSTMILDTISKLLFCVAHRQPRHGTIVRRLAPQSSLKALHGSRKELEFGERVANADQAPMGKAQ